MDGKGERGVQLDVYFEPRHFVNLRQPEISIFKRAIHANNAQTRSRNQLWRFLQGYHFQQLRGTLPTHCNDHITKSFGVKASFTIGKIVLELGE
jgi:hypothetical protein